MGSTLERPRKHHVADGLDHGGAGLVPRRRASALGARLADLVLFFVGDLASAFGDAGAVGSSRTT